MSFNVKSFAQGREKPRDFWTELGTLLTAVGGGVKKSSINIDIETGVFGP